MQTPETDREWARRRLAKFAKYRDQSYLIDPFHADLAHNLDKVIAGTLDRVIIQAPPQHGKSRLASVELPAAWLGHHPDSPVIMTSYAAELAQKHSREVRSVIESDQFAEVFPGVRLDPRSHKVARWSIDGHKAEFIASGVGGPITGLGAPLGIIDDPVKNWEEGQSRLIRERIWTWYQSTFLTRIWEGGRIVLIMTRWHPEDLAGKLIESEGAVEDGGRWTVLNYPALAEPSASKAKGWRPDTLKRPEGEPLAPTRYSAKYLEEMRNVQGSIIWSSLYQQRPSLLEGGVIKVDRFTILDTEPLDIQRSVRFWDFASTPDGASADPDYTAGVKIGKLSSGRWVITGIEHGRLSPAEGKARLKRTANIDGQSVQIRIEQEPGSAGVFVIADLVALLAGYDAKGERATGAQLTRVIPFAAQVEAGNIDIVRGPWLNTFLDECRAYRGDGNTHDDQVVAAAGAFRALSSPGAVIGTPLDVPDPETEVHTWDQ